jgi:hypothetical protein
MKTLKRKTRSDKFPLTFHTTGQYCKKIKGKMYYFGSDKKEAIQRYLGKAAYLHGHQENLQKPIEDHMTLKQLQAWHRICLESTIIKSICRTAISKAQLFKSEGIKGFWQGRKICDAGIKIQATLHVCIISRPLNRRISKFCR